MSLIRDDNITRVATGVVSLCRLIEERRVADTNNFTTDLQDSLPLSSAEMCQLR